MLRTRTSLVRLFALLTVVAVGMNAPIASAVVVFNNNNSDWTTPANWTPAAVPSAADDGEIPTGLVALGDGLLTGADIFVQDGGTLRVTSATQIVSGGVINVESGGRMEYTVTSGDFANHNTVNLEDGSSIGRHISSTSPIAATVADDLNIIGLSSTVTIQGAHPGGRSLNITGNLTGDVSSTLIATSQGTSNGTIALLSATDNTYAGKTIIRSTFGTTRGIFAVEGENPLGTGAAGDVEVENLGTFRLRSNTGVTGTGDIQVQTGGRIEIDGTSSGNTIQLMDGSELGRGETSFVTNTSTDTINIDPTSTVTFTGINSSRRLILDGTLTADANTTILIQNQGGNGGYFQFNDNATSGIDASIIVSGTSETTRGQLAASGTNALGSGSTNHVVIGNHGTLQLLTNAGLQSSTDIIEVQSGGRVNFDSGSSTGNRIQMADNTSLGRAGTSPTTAFTSDIIELAAGGNFTFFGAIANPRALELNGDISGTNVTITTKNAGLNHEEIRINSTSGNALSGLMIVEGEILESPATVFNPYQGVLGLEGVSPLGTMDLEVRDLGIVLAQQGSLDDQPNVTVLDGGLIRFRAVGSSTWTNSTLRGDGVVRSEVAGGDEIADGTLQELNLNDVLISPGTSAGTLTIQASTLSLNADSILEIELGSTSDLLDIEGNLDLTAGPTLSLLPLSGLNVGDYVIATYSGTISGEFGDIQHNLGAFGFASIDYGILNPGSITVSITAIPEPTTGLLAMFGLAGLYIRRRRNRA